jgi:hypothetical protein
MSRFRMIFAPTGTRYEIDGKPVSKRTFERRCPKGEPGMPNVPPPSVWPKESISRGCPAKRVPHVRKRLAESGLTGVEVLDNGNLKMDSRRAMTAFDKFFGQHESNDVR